MHDWSIRPWVEIRRMFDNKTVRIGRWRTIDHCQKFFQEFSRTRLIDPFSSHSGEMIHFRAKLKILQHFTHLEVFVLLRSRQRFQQCPKNVISYLWIIMNDAKKGDTQLHTYFEDIPVDDFRNSPGHCHRSGEYESVARLRNCKRAFPLFLIPKWN